MLPLDPAPLAGRQALAADLERLTAYVTASPPTTPDGKVLLPGEIERRTRAERLAHGIPLAADTLARHGAARVGSSRVSFAPREPDGVLAHAFHEQPRRGRHGGVSSVICRRTRSERLARGIPLDSKTLAHCAPLRRRTDEAEIERGIISTETARQS